MEGVESRSRGDVRVALRRTGSTITRTNHSQAPVVAIVGRPNVGKSTLFNRLIGARRAIVHDQPGVTRDRITGLCELDDGGWIELVDTGGLVPGEDPIGLNAQVLMAVDESAALIFVVDGAAGLTPADEAVWEELRRRDRPTVLAVNKGDTKAAVEGAGEFHRLGVGPLVLVSAEHGRGLGELLEELAPLVGELAEPPPERAPSLAIVGRPNVGKSSLVNRLLGVERTLVAPVAGTTRDPIDTRLDRGDGRELVLVDTAGIRRRSRVSDAPEELAVMMAKRQIARADAAALVIDAAAGVTSGDLAIAGEIWEQGRAPLVLVNKWDLLGPLERERLDLGWPRLEELLRGPARVNVSATTGRGIERILPAVDRLLERYGFEIGTAELNRILEGITRRHRAPSRGGSAWRLRYATQVATAPPTFVLFANRRLPQNDGYRRYLENALRDALALDGIPIRLVVREREPR